MRSTPALGLALVLLVACGDGSSPPVTPPATPPSVPEPVSPELARRWVDDHVAMNWFADASTIGAEEAMEEELSEESDGGQAGPSGGVIGHGPSGDVPPDSREAHDPSPSPPTSPGGPPPPREAARSRSSNDDAPAGAEVREENPRFGGVDLDDEARFGPAGEGVPSLDTPDAPETWQRSQIRPNASKLEVGDDEALPLERFQAAVRVDGFRARVVLDLVYRNPTTEVLEGLFKLRVPDEASVHFLAFGGVVAEAPLLVPVPSDRALALSPAALMAARGGPEILREARVVPRERAQRAYAAETAKRVDPALLEWSGAGVFSTSLAPLEPGQLHRVTVAYDMDLTAAGGQRELVLDVPADAASARVVIETGGRHADGGSDVTVSPPARTDVLADRTVWTFDEFTERRITFRLATTGATALVGDDPDIGPHFAVSAAPDVPATEALARPAAVFVLDASMSSNPERMNVWLALVRAILDSNRADLREFAVLFFNVETWWWRDGMTPNDPANVEAFLRDARDLALEGATDVGAALTEGASPAWRRGELDADVFLLSDGAETWGATDALDVAVAVDAPVFCYTTGLPGTDVRALRALARETGGAVFAVVGEGEVATAAVAHRRRPWSLRSVSVAGCEDVLVAGRPSSVFPGQRLRIAGRGRPAAGDGVVLTLEQDGRTRDVTIPLRSVVASSLAPRTYGEIATGQLEDLAPLARDEARAYATHYRVAGQTCSLLMLESEEAYRAYGIVPEEDAAAVRQRPVSAVTGELEDARGRLHGQPREAFLAWLDRLERASGVTFDDLDAVRAAARSLPPEAFDVRPPALRCRTRVWGDVGGAFQEQLAAAEPEYGAALAEAAARSGRTGAADALRALSSLVEADSGSADLLRDVAFSAMEWGLHGQAQGLLRRVQDARPHEPETYRALAECLERIGHTDLAVLMYEVAHRGQWDARFGAFPLVNAMDYSRLLRRIESGEAQTRLGALTAASRVALDRDYIDASPDLVVTLTWNTDRTDIDLHVTDPTDEECSYQHPRTRIGGAISTDVTRGYGPETFILGHAIPGEYAVRVHYFGSDSLRRTLRSRAYATVYRRWARADEQVTRHALLLEEEQELQEVVRVNWE